MTSFDHLPATYTSAASVDYFADLLAAARIVSDAASFYRSLGQILRQVAEQHTSFKALSLGGLFAKIDYLCKEHNIAWSLRHELNAARQRINQYGGGDVASDSLPDVRLADLRAVSEFVAILFSTHVPPQLESLFPASALRQRQEPAEERPLADVLPQRDVLRVVVVAWDASAMTVRSEDTESLLVPFVQPSGDWTYLTKLLSEGAQLNLVRPKWADSFVTADLIIYEPDYLVDVTAIAGCFEEYSQSPFLHLLHKIAPRQHTAATLLGNLAGQILDAEIHGTSSAVETFLREHALTLLALEDSGSLDLDVLLRDAEVQRRNIQAALHEGLSQHVGHYQSSAVMLEPSFVSEMLGLQGRMDFLQTDHRVLIEQKSGKAGFVAGASSGDVRQPPRQQPKHYVQMLLYMAVLRYNFSREYREHGGNLQAFLLYSKYSEPLLGLGPAPRLLFDAIKVRNGLVWYEGLYCRDGVRLLERITPDSLNQLHAHGVLWERYQRPQLEALLRPVRNASPLERDYYCRMLQFVSQEHYIAKVGNNTSQANCYASKWYLSLVEKRENGEIYERLTLAPFTEPTPDSGVATLRFFFNERVDADTTNFRLGDVVIVYPYDASGEPDCRRTMVHRGTLTEVTPDCISIMLRAPQTDATIFTREAHRPWAVEHDSIESSFGGLYSGIHAFLSAPQSRRDLLLLQRSPKVDETARLRGEYGRFDELQRRVKAARELFLIIGPPGTGKTSFGMLYTLKEQLLEPGSNVLLLSYTNRAVDEICSKLVEESIPFLRIGNPHNCDAAYHPYLLQNVPFSSLADMRLRLAATRVFVGTTTTISSLHSLFQLKRFDLAIIDEASQILEPHLLGLLSEQHEGDCAIAKIVMIGDHKQLPAVVQQSAEQSAVGELSLRAIGLTDCRGSLFERLLQRYVNDPSVTYMLRHQGRMHRDISAFPNDAFYEGRLDVVPLPHQIEEGGGRLKFIAAPLPVQSVNDKVNLVEADIIARLVSDIAERCPDDSIGVIVPYRNQISAIRSLLPEALRSITIDTVERYQGSQRDHIIYGFTIQKRYQLAFLTSNVFVETTLDGRSGERVSHVIDRKLNVALTRARKYLYIVGNPELLSQNQTFARLMDFAQKA